MMRARPRVELTRSVHRLNETPPTVWEWHFASAAIAGEAGSTASVAAAAAPDAITARAPRFALRFMVSFTEPPVAETIGHTGAFSLAPPCRGNRTWSM